MSPVSLWNTWDYVSLCAIVMASFIVGLYHVNAARKTTSTRLFLVSNHELGIIPLILSILATNFSASGMLGFPLEFYMTGVSFYIIAFTVLICTPFGSHLYLPVFFKLNRNTIFEYFELRFSKVIRISASLMLNIQLLLLSAIVLYAPALVLTLVTGFNLWATVVPITIVCTIYTSLGGIKAVVWADVTQFLVMFGVILLIIIKGTIDVGGPKIIWERLQQGQRDNVFITYMGAAVGVSIFFITLGLVGIIMYGYYHQCDPLLSKKIEFRDQMVVLFAVETLSFCPGLCGVFVGGIMCATLSTLSSNLNSIMAITISDYVKVLKPDLSDVTSMKLSKALVVLYGGLALALVSIMRHFGGVLKAIFAIFGIAGGSFLAVFTVGMLLPWVNNKGAMTGFFASMVIPVWAFIGNLVTSHIPPHAPLSTHGCSNSTPAINTTIQILPKDLLQQFYSIPSFWYSSWCLIVGLIVSVVVSKFTGFQDIQEVDPDLFFPFVRKYLCNQRARLNQEMKYTGYRKRQMEQKSLFFKETNE